MRAKHWPARLRMLRLKFFEARKATVYLLFGAGICLILQPWYADYMHEKQQQKLLTGWDQLHTSEQRASLPLSSPPTVLPIETERTAAEKPATDHESTPDNSPAMIDGLVVQGTISIEKLNLREPIIEGTGEKSLQLGIGVVEPDRQPAVTGNFVLAGHNSRTYGKHFNRLNELKEGDPIVISTGSKSYVYSVAERFMVEPNDLTVLSQSADTKELTLITCDQIVNPTRRFIVKARLKSESVS